MTSESSEDVANRILCQSCFHQSLYLPATSSHPRLRVTFSTSTNFSDTSLPVILFITPLFGTRWCGASFDHLACTTGVRVIVVDRPGFGGSTSVPLDNRVKVWLETVPALLSQLSVHHVALATHSAGAIYTLNTLYHLPEILSPRTPYVAFLAPFVPKEFSHATLPRLSALLPSAAIDRLSLLSGIFLSTRSRLGASLSWSSGLVPTSFSSSLKTEVPDDDETSEEWYGLTEDQARKFEGLMMKYQFAESVRGGDEDAKLCLGKGKKEDWGVAADYRGCIADIAGKVEGLEVAAYFAESDRMIGEKGREFFEECWREKEGVKFTAEVCEGMDHDSVLGNFEYGGLWSVFERVAELGV